jgi:hypothetical protein
MIRVLSDVPEGVLGFEASGKLTADDYRTVLEPAIAASSEAGSKVRILLVFPEAFGGMESGAVWHDLKMGVHDWSSWEKIALVTDQEWMRNGLRMFAWAVPGEARAFTMSARDEALAWVSD